MGQETKQVTSTLTVAFKQGCSVALKGVFAELKLSSEVTVEMK